MWEPDVVEAFQAFSDPEKATTEFEFMARTAMNLDFELGLRTGELVALQFSDRVGNVVKVRRARSMIGGRKDIVEKKPKTGSGKRDVGMSSRAQALWDALPARQSVPSIGGYLFVDEAGQPVHPSRIIAEFERLRDGFLAENPHVARITFRDVRSCAITRWVRRGVDAPMVKTMAGHKSYAFTIDRYFKATAADTEAAAAKLG